MVDLVCTCQDRGLCLPKDVCSHRHVSWVPDLGRVRAHPAEAYPNSCLASGFLHGSHLCHRHDLLCLYAHSPSRHGLDLDRIHDLGIQVDKEVPLLILAGIDHDPNPWRRNLSIPSRSRAEEIWYGLVMVVSPFGRPRGDDSSRGLWSLLGRVRLSSRENLDRGNHHGWRRLVLVEGRRLEVHLQ